MLTGDENIVDVQLFVQYMVQDPVKFLFGAEDPVNTLRASAEVALRGVVGEKDIDATMTEGRGEVQDKVKANLQKLLNIYNTGLVVTQAGLQAVDAPTQVREAFHDVVRAWEDRERLIQEAQGVRADVIPKARGQAEQEILEAEAYKAQRVIRARGDAQRFSNIFAGIRQIAEGDAGAPLPGKRGTVFAGHQEVHNGRWEQQLAAVATTRAAGRQRCCSPRDARNTSASRQERAVRNYG